MGSKSYLIFGLLGILAYYEPLILILFVVIYPLILTRSSPRKKDVFLLVVLPIMISLESLIRVIHNNDFLPHEFGKYIIILTALIFLIIQKNRIHTVVILLLILAIPSYVLGLVFSDYEDFKFNGTGFAAVLFVLTIQNKKSRTLEELLCFLKSHLMGLSSCAVLLLVLYFNLTDYSFSLSGNYQITNGISPNQVSTVFGAASLISYIVFDNKRSYLMLLLGIVFLTIALLTLSRGGIIVALIGLCYYEFKKGGRPVRLVLSTLVLLSLFGLINNVTDGSLWNRYQGETSGTLAGTKVKDISTLTTGRIEVVNQELILFSQKPILGWGVGGSIAARSRIFDDNTSTHVEFSRLLSEHGVLVFPILLAALLLMVILVIRPASTRRELIISTLLLVGILTTFHSGMRTYLTPFTFLTFSFFR